MKSTFSLLVLILLAGSLHAQPNSHWKKIGQFDLGPYGDGFGVDGVYFADDQHGIVSLQQWTGGVWRHYGGIYVTSDQGATWRKAVLSPNLDNYSGWRFSGIRMLDPLNGIAAFSSGAASGAAFDTVPGTSGIWKTSDGGLSWTVVVGYPYCSSAHVSSGQILQSTGGIAFVDSVVGMTSPDLPYISYIEPIWYLNTTTWFYDQGYGHFTTDGGRTWRQMGDNTLQSPGLYYQASSRKFFVSPDNDTCHCRPIGTIWSAYLDSNNALPHFVQANTDVFNGLPPFGWISTGAIDGAANAIYVQTASRITAGFKGMWRSTNEGQNWASIGGPTNTVETRFSVPESCNGGIVAAADSNGGIWITTDGGDGSLIAVGPPIIAHSSFDSTPVCLSTQAWVSFTSVQCRTLTITSDSVQNDPTGAFTALAHSFPIRLEQGTSDTFGIRFHPKQGSGHYTASLHIIGYDSSKYGRIAFDTVITINATAFSNSSIVMTSANKINYHAVQGCQSRDTLLTLSNLTCDTIALTTAQLAGSGFTLTGSKLPFILPPDSIYRVLVHYAPKSDGDTAGTLLYYVNQRGVLDTVQVKLSGQFAPPGPELSSSSSSISFADISLCAAPSDTLIILRNVGCDSLIIDSDSLLLGQGYTIDQLSIPVVLSPDSRVAVHVHFKPTTTVQSTSTLRFHVTAGHGQNDSIQIVLSGKGVAGEGILALSNVTATLPTTTFCSGDSTTFLYRNSGCDTLILTKVQLSGDPDFTTSLANTSSLAPGDSVLVTIHFVPQQKNNRSATFTIRSHSIKDPSHEADTTLTFSANVISGNSLLSLDTTTRDFGSGSLCRSADTAIVFKNAGCDTMSVNSVTLVGANMILVGGNAKPTLAPGESDTLHVQYVASGAGTSLGTLTVNAGTNPDTTAIIHITAQAIAPESVHLATSIGRSNILWGDTTTVFVYANSPVSNRGLNAISFGVSYDGDLLTETNATTSIPNATFSVASLQQSGITATLPITITGNNLSLDPSQPIAAIHFRTTLGDSSTTPISVTKLTLNNGDASYANCTLSADAGSSSFVLAHTCGDSTIVAALEKKLAFTIESITPNPTTGKLSIVVDNNSQLPIHFSLFDALGREVESGVLGNPSQPPAGLRSEKRVKQNDDFDLNLGSHESGSYFLRLSTPERVETRRIVLQR